LLNSNQTLEHGKNRVLCVCACVTHTHEHDTRKTRKFRVCTQFHTRNTKISCMRFFLKMSEHLKKLIKIKVSISSGYWSQMVE